MNSGFNMIVTLLKEFDPGLAVYTNRKQTADVARLVTVTQLPDHFHDNEMYLIYSTQLPAEQPPDILPNYICCLLDVPAPQWISAAKDTNFILLQNIVAPEQIAAIVNRVNWEQQAFAASAEDILEALYYGLGVQAIADITARLMSNPVLILDVGLKILAQSDTVKLCSPMIQTDTATGFIDHAGVSFLQSQGWLSSLREQDMVLYVPDDAVKSSEIYKDTPQYGWCHTLIRVNGVVAAYLVVFGENAPIYDYHKNWIAKIAKITSVEFQKDKRFVNSHGFLYESLLTDLLENRITDHSIIERRLNLLDVKLGKHLYVVTVRRFSDTTGKPFTALEMHSIRSLFPGSLAVTYEKDIVLLIHSNDDSFCAQIDMGIVNNDLETGGLIAGVSNEFMDATELRTRYLQAVRAMEYGKQTSSNRIFFYSDHFIYDVLEAGLEKFDYRDLCHPGILRMHESDFPGDKDLLQTLYLYLLYMKDLTRVTEALSIHKSTLFYRLNRIKSTLNIDFNDGDIVFRLLFSFKLLGYREPSIALDPPPQSKTANTKQPAGASG